MKSSSNQTKAPAQGGGSPSGKGADTLSDRELFKNLIQARYRPTGTEDDMQVLKTSRDLQYAHRDMCTVSISTVAEVMQSMGYTFRFVADLPHWVLFTPPDFESDGW